MRISYDVRHDLLYIYIVEGSRQVEPVSVNDDIAIDFDEKGRIAGIEVVSASRYLDVASLVPVTVERS